MFYIIAKNSLSIFMETKSSTNIIFVPNLKELKTQEDGFHKF